MKTAIYIEDGVVQLVITPESDFEKNALKSFTAAAISAQIFEGAFYDCRGGWTRQKEYHPRAHTFRDDADRSLILRAETPKESS